jgi:hypothetical protein
LLIASAVVLIAIIAINGWSLWRRRSAPPVAAAPTPPAEQPIDGPPLTGEAEHAAAPDFVGPVRATPSAMAAPRPARSAKSGAPPVLVSPPSTPGAAEASRAPQPIDTAVQAPTAAGAAPVVPRAGPDTAPAPPKPFYGPADRDVTPPRALSPQLLAMLSQQSPGVRPDVMMIAVLINEQGTVDSVQAVNNPVSLSESVMLTGALSAVKTWHFRPAVKDGVPVKYRQVVPLRLRANP